MSNRRSILDFPRNESGLVDEFIGTAFDAVYQVYLHLTEVLNSKSNAERAEAAQKASEAAAVAAIAAKESANASAISAAESAAELALAVETAVAAKDEAAISALSAAASAEAAHIYAAGLLSPAAVAPTQRLDGTPLQLGDRYFNTTTNTEYIFKASGWLPNDSITGLEELHNNLDPAQGSAKVGWIAPATGAIPRDVSDRLSEFLSVADFGGVRDNFTDNTSVIQAAIDSLAPNLYIPTFMKYDRSLLVNSERPFIVDDSTGIRVTNADFWWKPGPTDFQLSAHRGFSTNSPENTMTAFAQAYASGADILECDVQITQDGVPVVIHDDSVDRTTNGTGNVKELTYEYISGLDAGSKFSPRFSSARVPKFEELVIFAKARGVKVCAEIKNYRQQSDIDLMLKVVQDHQAEDLVSFAAFNMGDLIYARAKTNKMTMCPLGSTITYLSTAAGIGGKVIFLLDYTAVLANPTWIDKIRSAGVDVGVWTVPSQEVSKQLLRLGVTYQIANMLLGESA